MNNSIYSAFNNKDNDMTRVIKDFKQFKQQRINPKEEVIKLMQNGSLSQQELNMYQGMANQLSGILN